MSTDRVDCSRAWYSEGATARAAQASPAIRSGHSRTGELQGGERAGKQGRRPAERARWGSTRSGVAVRVSAVSLVRCLWSSISASQRWKGEGAAAALRGCSRLASSSTRAHAGLVILRLLRIPASEFLDVPAGGGTARAVLLPPAGRLPTAPSRTDAALAYTRTGQLTTPSTQLHRAFRLSSAHRSLSPVAMANLVRLLRRIRLEGRAAAQ